MTRQRSIRLAWTVLIGLALVFSLKTFVGDVYHVDSGSMEPSIIGLADGGEHVLVMYDRSAPKRFDYVVILRDGESTPIVKRVVGLPGESVLIANGDLLIDNARLPASASRPDAVAVFDDRWMRVDEHFAMGTQDHDPWTAADGAWELDARKIPINAQAGLMFLKRALTDDYLDLDHALVHQATEVNDAVVECEFRALDLAGQLRLGLVEQGDTFQAVIVFRGDGHARVDLTRRFRSDAEEVLESADIDVPADAWRRIRFANIDNTLVLELPDTGVRLEAAYKENHTHPSDFQRAGKSFGSRVYLGGEGARLSFRHIRVLRDFQYTERGEYGVREPIDLGPDQYFVLGDNSAQSRDSREWGPVRLSQIVGRPVCVVWPPARMRSLTATPPAADRSGGTLAALPAEMSRSGR